MNIKFFKIKKTRSFNLFRYAIISTFTFISLQHCIVSTAQELNQEKTINLTLNDAIDMALKNNVIIKLAHEGIEERKAIRTQNKANLMPHVSLAASQERIFWHNLATDGMPESGVLGPFNSFDAQVQLTQRVFDLSALSGFIAQGKALDIASLEEGFAKQQVILSAVFSYLNVLNNEEKLRAVDEDIKLSQKLIVMAEHQLSAGVVTEIDVVRAKTRQAQQRAHRQDILQSLNTSYFQLMRIIGLPLDKTVKLSDSLEFFSENALPLEDAIDAAFKDRIEMTLAREKIKYQDQKLSQAKKERLPKIDLFGKYGQSGTTPSENSHEAGSMGLKLTMPFFAGGNTKGKIQEALSHKRTEEIKRDDIQIQVEEDVRLALQTLATSTDRVNASQEALDLAEREVELAQNQYHAGMENNIAVIEAQAVLERTHEAYITAVMQYDLARVNYFSAIGKTESFHLNPLMDIDKRDMKKNEKNHREYRKLDIKK